jgi:hypothetical protein
MKTGKPIFQLALEFLRLAKQLFSYWMIFVSGFYRRLAGGI